ncbi:MAG: hypothetical protein GIW95_11205 [Candidatus Eremiobacteraeota bacterium]|nr:hypothetical protein [Candidatus Eremiobacteraeota bacterium]
MSARIAVGVDAGGTGTSAVASRDGIAGNVVRGGPANASSRGVAAASAAIVAAIRSAITDAEPASIYVGAAGAGAGTAAGDLETALRASFGNGVRIVVRSDVECALRAAIPDGPGLVLIAGTGSAAYAEHGDARVVIGGHGYLAGDEGSAFWIGFSAVKLLTRVYDSRAPRDETSGLVERVLGCADRASLLGVLYGQPIDVAKIASLAPSVVAFAGKGNRASTKIVQGAAQELGDLVRHAARAANLSAASPRIAFAGGLLRENSILTFLLETRVTNEVAGAEIVRVRDEPAFCALRFAEASLA